MITVGVKGIHSCTLIEWGGGGDYNWSNEIFRNLRALLYNVRNHLINRLPFGVKVHIFVLYSVMQGKFIVLPSSPKV